MRLRWTAWLAAMDSHGLHFIIIIIIIIIIIEFI